MLERQTVEPEFALLGMKTGHERGKSPHHTSAFARTKLDSKRPVEGISSIDVQKQTPGISYDHFWNIIEAAPIAPAQPQHQETLKLPTLTNDWRDGRVLFDATQQLIKARANLLRADEYQRKLLDHIAVDHPRGPKIIEYLRRGAEERRFSENPAVAVDLQIRGHREATSSEASDSEGDRLKVSASDLFDPTHEWFDSTDDFYDSFNNPPAGCHTGQVDDQEKQKQKNAKRGGAKPLQRENQLVQLQMAINRHTAQAVERERKRIVTLMGKNIGTTDVIRQGGSGSRASEQARYGGAVDSSRYQAQDILQLHRDLIKADPVTYMKHCTLPVLPYTPFIYSSHMQPGAMHPTIGTTHPVPTCQSQSQAMQQSRSGSTIPMLTDTFQPQMFAGTSSVPSVALPRPSSRAPAPPIRSTSIPRPQSQPRVQAPPNRSAPIPPPQSQAPHRRATQSQAQFAPLTSKAFYGESSAGPSKHFPTQRERSSASQQAQPMDKPSPLQQAQQPRR